MVRNPDNIGKSDSTERSKQLCDFLEGTRTLRSDVLDRLAQAVGAKISAEPTPPRQPEPTRIAASPPQP
jgi:hypothetical protein